MFLSLCFFLCNDQKLDVFLFPLLACKKDIFHNKIYLKSLNVFYIWDGVFLIFTENQNNKFDEFPLLSEIFLLMKKN